jgi:hypothetical protein
MHTRMSNIAKINHFSDKFVVKDVKQTYITYLCTKLFYNQGWKLSSLPKLPVARV